MRQSIHDLPIFYPYYICDVASLLAMTYCTTFSSRIGQPRFLWFLTTGCFWTALLLTSFCFIRNLWTLTEGITQYETNFHFLQSRTYCIFTRMYKKYRNFCKNNNSKINCESAIGQHLLTNPECVKTYTDDNFRIIGQARSSFHLSVLESVYIKTQNPVLCKQKDFIFSLGIFK